MVSPRNSILAVGVLAAAFLASPGTAAAGPGGTRLIETSCSYEQLAAAARVEAPQLADVLAQRPDAQAKLRAFLALPVDQRERRVQDTLDRNPEWQATIDEKRNTPEGQDKMTNMQRIADTCHGY